jgi:hypothetical protein
MCETMVSRWATSTEFIMQQTKKILNGVANNNRNFSLKTSSVYLLQSLELNVFTTHYAREIKLRIVNTIFIKLNGETRLHTWMRQLIRPFSKFITGQTRRSYTLILPVFGRSNMSLWRCTYYRFTSFNSDHVYIIWSNRALNRYSSNNSLQNAFNNKTITLIFIDENLIPVLTRLRVFLALAHIPMLTWYSREYAGIPLRIVALHA